MVPICVEKLLVHLFTIIYSTYALAELFLKFVKNPLVFWEGPIIRKVEPKCLRDPKFGKHKFMQLKNIQLHYVENGDPNKPLMLFLHGFPEFWYAWRYQLLEFSKDYWCVAVDLRGFGDSDKPKSKLEYSLDYLVEDLVQIINYFDRKKVTLVGHDWGGLISWSFLELYPHMVDKYIFINGPHIKMLRYFMLMTHTQRQKSWYAFWFQIPHLPEVYVSLQDFQKLTEIFPYFNKEEMEAYKYQFSKQDAITPMLNYYRNMIPNLPWTRLPSMDTKTAPAGLFIFGLDDQFVHSGIMKKAEQMIPNLIVKPIPNVRHFSYHEAPNIVNKLMREFLAINK